MAMTFKTTVVKGYTFVVAHTNNEYKTCFIKSIKAPNGKPVAHDRIYTGTRNDFATYWGCVNMGNGQMIAPNPNKPEATFEWLVDNWLVYSEVERDLIWEAWDAFNVAHKDDNDGIFY